MADLQGKVVVVSGAARGIGAATSRELARRGARLGLIGLEPERLEALADELGPGHFWAEADVTDQASLDAAVGRTVAQLGGIDAVMANAGVSNLGTVRMTDPEAFARTIDVNLTGVFRTVRATLPHVIERRGYVLVIASMSSFAPLAGMAAYTASKAGAEAFANALRQEVGHLGVAVGSAHPSWIGTDLVRDIQADLTTFREMLKELPPPLNRVISVEECATALADGIEERARRIYVPKSVVMGNVLRSLITSPLAERVMRRRLATMVPRMEEEIGRLGRFFGANHALGRPREVLAAPVDASPADDEA